MAITNNMATQAPNVKTQDLPPLNATDSIKLALRAMIMIQGAQSSDQRKNGFDRNSRPLNKRQGEISSGACPSKRQRHTLTDDVLDEAASEVCEVLEWELILANWNTEQENLHFNWTESPIGDTMITN
jgi:hypothetical protein